jgi:hypothetical protein
VESGTLTPLAVVCCVFFLSYPSDPSFSDAIRGFAPSDPDFEIGAVVVESEHPYKGKLRLVELQQCQD